MFALFKPEFLHKHLKIENFDMSFIDEGGQDWWYIYDLVGFLIEVARRASPKKWPVLLAVYRDWQKRHNDYPVPKSERKRVLLEFLTDTENMPALLIIALANNKVLSEAFQASKNPP